MKPRRSSLVLLALVAGLFFNGTVNAASISVGTAPSLTVSPLAPVDEKSSTLTYSATGQATVSVKAVGIPNWLSSLKLYTTDAPLPCGNTTYTNSGAALSLSTEFQDFITGIGNCSASNINLTYVATSKETFYWEVVSGTQASITITYQIMET